MFGIKNSKKLGPYYAYVHRNFFPEIIPIFLVRDLLEDNLEHFIAYIDDILF